MGTIPMVWHPKYATTAAPTNSTTKGAEVVEALRAKGFFGVTPGSLGIFQMVQPPFPGVEAVAQRVAEVHDPWYVDALRTGAPRRLAESQGFLWSPEFAESVFRVWAGQTYAVQLAKDEGMVLHPVSGAHHAMPTRGGGFCTFNWLVQPVEAGVRAIIDLDAHHGDGTKAFLDADGLPIKQFDLWVDAGVPPMSVNGSYYAGYRDVHGLFQRLGELPRWLDYVQPDHVVYQAGMDPYRNDPLGGARGVDREALERRDRLVIDAVRERDIPLVVVLAGGYSDMAVQLHTQTAEVMARYR